jgi:hypothetical protein
MGSDIGSSYDTQALALALRWLRKIGSRLEASQGGAGAAEARHEGADRDLQL